jgi:putative Flp pilus-assembly TadE/G-like protein
VRRRRGRGGDERGQTSLLIVGLAVVVLLMVGVVVDASAAYLRRSGLDSLADGAALAAAEGIEGRQVYQGGLGPRAELDPAMARGYVADYLRAAGAGDHYRGLRYQVAVGTDRVVVHVSAPLRLPIALPAAATRPVISATAASFVVVGQ